MKQVSPALSLACSVILGVAACGRGSLPTGIDGSTADGSPMDASKGDSPKNNADGGGAGGGAGGAGGGGANGGGGAGGAGGPGGAGGSAGAGGAGGSGGSAGSGGAGGGGPTPGSSPVGGACVLPGDCIAAPGGLSGPDCYTDGLGFPGGYCLITRCSVDAQDCPGADAVCVDFGGGGGGPRTACVAKCGSSTDCRAGYRCATIGAGKGCWHGCTMDSECPAGQACTFAEGSMIGACKTTSAKATGEPCKSATECRGAYCVSEKDYGWPYGYCSSNCTADGADCDMGTGVCVGGGGGGECMKKCDTSNDCRPGYECITRGRDRVQKWCEPNCTLDTQCENMSCHAGTGYC